MMTRLCYVMWVNKSFFSKISSLNKYIYSQRFQENKLKYKYHVCCCCCYCFFFEKISLFFFFLLLQNYYSTKKKREIERNSKKKNALCWQKCVYIYIYESSERYEEEKKINKRKVSPSLLSFFSSQTEWKNKMKRKNVLNSYLKSFIFFSPSYIHSVLADVMVNVYHMCTNNILIKINIENLKRS